MTYHSTSLADAPARSAASVAVLRCRDEFNMDPTPLKILFETLPDHKAEDIVCRALEDIASRLNKLQIARSAGEFAEIRPSADRVAVIATQIGLTEVSLVAGHMAKASQMNCGVALGATMARLERAFDAAVSQIWDFPTYG